MSYQDGNDLKTYIPGIGFLVTNLETAESHIFPDDDDAETIGDLFTEDELDELIGID